MYQDLSNQTGAVVLDLNGNTLSTSLTRVGTSFISGIGSGTYLGNLVVTDGTLSPTSVQVLVGSDLSINSGGVIDVAGDISSFTTFGSGFHSLVTVNSGGSLKASSISFSGEDSGSITLNSGGLIQTDSALINHDYRFGGGGNPGYLIDGGIWNNAGNMWVTGNLLSGASGTSAESFYRQTAGVVNSDTLIVYSNGPTAKADVSWARISGGSLNLSDTLFVGSTGMPGWYLQDGGNATVGSVAVASGSFFDHTDGTLTIDGGTFDNGGGVLEVSSNSGTPLMRFKNSASASQTSVQIGGIVGDMGQLEMAGGRLAAGDLDVDAGGSVNVTTGLINIDSGLTLLDVTAARQGDTMVGWDNTGDLTVSASGMHTTDDDLNIGVLAGGSGTVTVTGTNSSITVGDFMKVGLAGSGVLNIKDNGLLTVRATDINATSTINASGGRLATTDLNVIGGAVNVTTGLVNVDTGLVALDVTAARQGDTYVGWTSTGANFRVAAGGTYTSNDDFEIGVFNGSSGTVTVEGASSLAVTDDLNVGSSGMGQLEVKEGSTVSADAIQIAQSASTGDGTLTVDGAGSTATAGDVKVGVRGAGNLVVSGGGIVHHTSTASDAIMASLPGSTGNLMVSGSGSMVQIDAGLLVGRDAMGIVTQSGGTVQVANTITLGSEAAGRRHLSAFRRHPSGRYPRDRTRHGFF